MERTVG
jgi:hypothetical protein